MESNYNNENIERFLRESSDQYRMYPSESVWKNIYSVLHTRRRWFGIGLILLLSAGFVTTIMLTNSSVTGIEQRVSEKRLLSDPVITKESSDNIEEEASPLVPYTSSFLQKEKSSVLKSLDLPSEKSLISTITITTIPSESIEKDINAETMEHSITNTAVIPGQVETDRLHETPPVYSPIPIHITDEITDQDLWVMNKNVSFFNNDRSNKKDAYKINSSFNRLLTIESVINTYTKRSKKLSFQYYFTPTISYRKLSENKSYLRTLNTGTTGSSSLYNNINSVVTHKPDMGLEVGVAARYTLNKNLKIRGGLQFNTSRYDIKAFSSPAERTTIALNTGYSVDSVSTVSNYRNFNGNKSDWLHNFYFQVSAPIGVELKLAGDDKVQFGVAGTLQPTYVIGDRAYLLSSNYKNYAEVPWLIRRWNMNTSFEAFVSYSTGKMNWQIGPQMRYQLYSSFVKEYPVKENLFDFGLKIAVSTNR